MKLKRLSSNQNRKRIMQSQGQAENITDRKRVVKNIWYSKYTILDANNMINIIKLTSKALWRKCEGEHQELQQHACVL